MIHCITFLEMTVQNEIVNIKIELIILKLYQVQIVKILSIRVLGLQADNIID